MNFDEGAILIRELVEKNRTVGLIEITGVDLALFVAKCFDLSVPIGLGFIPHEPGPLSPAEIDQIVSARSGYSEVSLNMDYVRGRCVKMTVRGIGDRLYIDNRWCDHTDYQLAELLEAIEINSDKIASARLMFETYEKGLAAIAVAMLEDAPEKRLMVSIMSRPYTAFNTAVRLGHARNISPEPFPDDGNYVFTVAA